MSPHHLRLFVGGALVVTFGALVAAQSPATVSTRVRDRIKAQEIGWQLQKTGANDDRFFHLWVNRAERIDITYEVRASDAEAAAWLDQVPNRVSVGGGRPLADVGDKALIWSGFSTTGSATIYFIKGRATVLLSAPSPAFATRIARLIAAQVHE